MELRVALVTGGDHGIGRGITLNLAEQGYQVVTFSNQENHVKALQKELLGKALKVQSLIGDTANREDVKRTVDYVMQTYGKIDLLCTAAAIKVDGDITMTDEPTWDRVFAVNVKGVYLFCHEVIPHMIGRKKGSVVLFSSPSANGEMNHIAYASSKGAILSLAKSLAMDCRKHHIRVNVLVPGFTRSGMTEHISEEYFQRKAMENVAGRVNEPEDIAHVVSFLASDQAVTISGAVIDIGMVHGQMVIK